MKKYFITLSCILSFLFLVSCGDANNSNYSASLSNELQVFLDGQNVQEKPSYGLQAFSPPNGSVMYQFNEPGTMKFSKRIRFPGQHILFIDVEARGDNNSEVQITSDTLDIDNTVITASPDSDPSKQEFWKLINLTKGNYDFTAESLNDEECRVSAHVGQVQKLDELSGTLQGEGSATYLYTLSTDTTLHFTVQNVRPADSDIYYGSIVTFYTTSDPEWSHTIYMGEDDKEIKDSIDFPAGDVILSFTTEKWFITFE